MGLIGMLDQIVHGNVEIISKMNKRLQVRLNIMIFILIDRLLADLDHICQLFLANAQNIPQFT